MDPDSLLELVERSRAEGIRADETRPKPPPLIMHRELRTRRRLSGTLQVHHISDELYDMQAVPHRLNKIVSPPREDPRRPTWIPTAMRTLILPFVGLYGSVPGSTSATSSSNTAWTRSQHVSEP
jgi:hypothetical protein